MLHACNYSQLHHSVRYSSAFLIKFKEKRKKQVDHETDDEKMRSIKGTDETTF